LGHQGTIGRGPQGGKEKPTQFVSGGNEKVPHVSGMAKREIKLKNRVYVRNTNSENKLIEDSSANPKNSLQDRSAKEKPGTDRFSRKKEVKVPIKLGVEESTRRG